MNLWDRQYKEFGFSAQRLYPNDELLRFLGSNFFSTDKSKRKRIKILEVGCGSGANLWMVAKEGFAAYGIDTSNEGLKLCRQMLKKWNVRADIRKGNMLALPFRDNYFDSIFDVASMQHLSFSQHKGAYAEIKRALKPSGKFFSYHIGNKSFSYRYGEGRVIDKFTLDNIKEPKALSDCGITCFISGKAAERMLEGLNFNNINIEDITKSYNNRKIRMHYLAIRAQK